ncbi:flagellar basal body rod protein FlgB [Arthrobacter sp. V4I6]|uniref:Ltp family lipoprotein n=1 Tax=unclassified Arthrobacter TaxID=235627 RepID=UPI00278B5818|nr:MULTISPECIES: Ltp family lipoprotein [unclassified Arthrobacter]MDQ0820731.1 flagellar basal body rod protein FlgB [Arthrobacter sp. V1I7]MDQ0854992.1 flagellar basal body rod protein FlgB [Arthrobacter sp. V4I6]
MAQAGTHTVKIRAIAKSANGKNRAYGPWVTRTVSVEAAAKTRTISQRNALETAARYLEYSAFSRSGLIRQLEYEKYSTADATWAVDRVTVNWKEQAAKAAKNYLEYSAFSRVGLIRQLEFEKYSTADATWAVDRVTVNWNEQAAKTAKNYLEYSAFSRGGLFDQLIFEGYTPQQAKYGVGRTGL